MKFPLKVGGLFGKAFVALGIVSIVPVLLIGWHVLRVDSQVLQNEIADKQYTLAYRISYGISEEISKQMQFFSVFAGLHADFENHPNLEQDDLKYLLAKNPQISFISVLNEDGTVQFSQGKREQPALDTNEIKNLFRLCIMQGREYVGAVRRVNGHLYVWMGFPIGKRDAKNKHIPQILLVEMNMDRLEQILQRQYFPGMAATILSREGEVITYAYQDAPSLGKWQTEIENTLRRIVPETKEDTPNTQKIKLSNDYSILVSQAPVTLIGWTVFVLQPANMTHTLLWENTFHSLGNIFLILFIVLAFVCAVGYWVLVPIIRPLKRLNQVALKFKMEDNYLPTEKDLIIPDNEIGDFEQIFLQMASALMERKNAILAAQERLRSVNAELEQRVEERTKELNQAMEDLVRAERLSTIGQMASIISHEIRNPLAVISNATRLIKTVQPPTEPKLIKQFSIIEEEIQQANRIIGEVLGFARSREMILSVVDLNSYLNEILLSFPLPPKVYLVKDLDPASAHLKVDVEELKQALRNLISNAAESMPEGGQITVGSRIGKKVACIYVEDEGPGITEEQKAQIFNPFYTTKARGTGLGLAVVRKAITRHKGKLFIYNGKQKGSVFAVYLQLYTKLGDTHYGEAS